jgi:hypothetical protein
MLDTYLETVERQRKQFTVYSDADASDLTSRLATRNVTVEHRPLPPTGPSPFVTVRENGEFVGALSLADFRDVLRPPIVRPGDWEGVSAGYRAVLAALEETVFTALDRRQLLATSREIEDRALRVGTGTLRVSFQSFSVFSTQLGLYTTLAAETALDIHVYGRPDWTPPAVENITYHGTDSLAAFWCLAFDGGSERSQACALIARETPDGYTGFWSYDPELVADVLRTLEQV